MSLWRNGDFLRLWAAQAGSAVGARITRTVLPMMAILTIDASPSQIALLSALGVAPGLLVSLFAGGLADRRAKRPVLILADLIRAGLILTLPLAAHFGALAMWQLYLVAGAIGGATTLFDIFDNSYLPALVEKDQLIEANSKLAASDAVAEGVGPWLGGVLMQVLGAPLALVFDAASYLWSALMLLTIRKPETVVIAAKEPGMFGDAIKGLRACREEARVFRLLLALGLMTLSEGFFMALYMVITIDLLALSPAAVGLVIGVGGIGGFLGALLAKPLVVRFGEWRALALAALVGMLSSIALPLSLIFPGIALPLLIGDQLIGDAFLTAFFILLVSLRQRVMASHVLGRVTASFHLLNQLALICGALMAGALVLVLGVDQVIWGAVIFGLSAAALLWREPRSSPPRAQ